MKPPKRDSESLAITIESHGVTLLQWCYRAHASIALENHAASKENCHSCKPLGSFLISSTSLDIRIMQAEFLQSTLEEEDMTL